HVQSVAQASFDAWVKYYRSDENTPNATISYYTKGSLVALALDLTLRVEGRGSLDEVMRLLWERSDGGPVSEADIAAALASVGGRSYEKELRAWVHGTDDLPWQPLLARAGIDWNQQPPTVAQRLGLRVSESALTGIKVSHVLRGGAGEAAGLSAGDELIGVDAWRLRRLDDLLRLMTARQPAELLVSRDQRLLRLALTLPPAVEAGAVSLNTAAIDKTSQAALALRRAWLPTT
ncbi:MAG: PDZ domain-containing protein, partial [Rhizobacter sp.]|nr:PDZ domain-containing protein [Rhizobacter sp.]